MSLRSRTAVILIRMAFLATATSAGVGCTQTVVPPLTAAEFEAKGKAAYEKALEAFYDRDWVAVPIKMEEIKKDYAGTRWARLAQLRIADAQFHQAEYPDAITSYREFLREFPNDPEVVYARYKVAECQFEARGDSSMSPPLEERDLVNVRDADRSISEFLRDYPDYPKRERLLYMQKWVRGMLARHELYVARYYLQQDRYKAAVLRTEYALVNFQDTGLEAEALVLLGEVYMKQHEHEQAAAAFSIVLNKYPDSPFVTPARNFMTRLEKIAPGVGTSTRGGAMPGLPPSQPAPSQGPPSGGAEQPDDAPQF